MMKPLLVSDDLDRHKFVGFVIETFEGLSEGAFAQEFLDFIPIAEMIVKDNLIVATVVIVAIVVLQGR